MAAELNGTILISFCRFNLLDVLQNGAHVRIYHLIRNKIIQINQGSHLVADIPWSLLWLMAQRPSNN